jgi:hypothetical protein
MGEDTRPPTPERVLTGLELEGWQPGSRADGRRLRPGQRQRRRAALGLGSVTVKVCCRGPAQDSSSAPTRTIDGLRKPPESRS